MKHLHRFVRRAAAFVLAAALCVCVLAPAASAATTMGGADTTLIPAEEENCLAWLFGTSDTITMPYLNIKGKGLQRNVTLNLVDCLVGITYTELGSIGSYVSASAAQQADFLQKLRFVFSKYFRGEAVAYRPVVNIWQKCFHGFHAGIVIFDFCNEKGMKNILIVISMGKLFQKHSRLRLFHKFLCQLSHGRYADSNDVLSGKSRNQTALKLPVLLILQCK